MSDPGLSDLRNRVTGRLSEEGCVAVGVCGVEPLTEARSVIEARRDAGLHDGMQFTFRNPARSTDPRRALPSAEAAVVAAMPYRSELRSDPDPLAADVGRYAIGDTYSRLRGALDAAASLLGDEGYRGVVLADDNALADRAIALRAGLGWLGKNSNLLVPGVGSWVVLGTVLTDAPFEPLAGSDRAGDCGSCRRCIDSCPTGALVAPGVMDASRCLSWLLQTTGSFPRRYRSALGSRIYGCDDCQESCPPNRRAPLAVLDDYDEMPGERVSLVFLLEAADDELLGSLGAWYIPRRDPRYVRRNALVVLGNSGSGYDPVVVELLERYLRHDDGLLVEHAAWAARALGRDDLLADALEESGPHVDRLGAEMARPHPRSGAFLAVPAARGRD